MAAATLPAQVVCDPAARRLARPRRRAPADAAAAGERREQFRQGCGRVQRQAREGARVAAGRAYRRGPAESRSTPAGGRPSSGCRALSSRTRGAALPASAGQLRGPFAPNVVCTASYARASRLPKVAVPPACDRPGGGAGGDAHHGARGGGGAPAAARAAEAAQGRAREPARGGRAPARRIHSQGPRGGSGMLHEAALLAAPQPTAAATAHRPGHISGRCFSDAGLPREARLGRSGCHPYVRAVVPPQARAKDACRAACYTAGGARRQSPAGLGTGAGRHAARGAPGATRRAG